jgi:hypothetical protein
MSNKVAGEADMDVTANWYWEGNVVEAIARFLAGLSIGSLSPA